MAAQELPLHRCVARACAANSLLFTVHSCLSKSSTCISTAQARKIWVAAAGACRDCALVVVPYAFVFVASAEETSCFPGPKSTFRDRCKGSERFTSKCRFRGRYLQHFGHGGDLRRALASKQVQGPHGIVLGSFGHVARLQLSWYAKHFVNLEVQISWQALHFVNLKMHQNADFVTGTAPCEP